MRRTQQRPNAPPTVAVLAAAALWLTAARAVAQPAESPEARANALYKEAAARIEDGKPEEAIPLLEDSLRLKPTGLGARYGLADCYERTGELARALSLFRSVAEEAKATGKAHLEGNARDRVAKLLPKLVLDVPASMRAVPELVVAIDGTTLAPPDFGQPRAVDPGEHVITASAPGKKPMTPRTVTTNPGTTIEVLIPPLENALPPPNAIVPPTAGGAARTVPTWSSQRTVGLVLGGVGLAGVVVGAVFGGQTLSASGEVKRMRYCTDSDPALCNPRGYELYQAAYKTAAISNVAFAIGGLAATAGVVTFVTARAGKAGQPSGSRVSAGPTVGVGMIGLSLQDEW